MQQHMATMMAQQQQQHAQLLASSPPVQSSAGLAMTAPMGAVGMIGTSWPMTMPMPYQAVNIGGASPLSPGPTESAWIQQHNPQVIALPPRGLDPTTWQRIGSAAGGGRREGLTPPPYQVAHAMGPPPAVLAAHGSSLSGISAVNPIPSPSGQQGRFVVDDVAAGGTEVQYFGGTEGEVYCSYRGRWFLVRPAAGPPLEAATAVEPEGGAAGGGRAMQLEDTSLVGTTAARQERSGGMAKGGLQYEIAPSIPVAVSCDDE